MKKGYLIVIIAIVCCALLTMIGYLNVSSDLVEMRNLAKKYEADIQVELQARFDKVPNLVEIVKGAAQHEQSIVDSITEARTKYNNAVATGDTAAMLEADTAIKAVITTIEEDYPEIAALDLYKDLMAEYNSIEDAIAVARRNYNAIVMEYNNMVDGVFTGFIAKSRGFERIEEFKAVPEANGPVNIDLTD